MDLMILMAQRKESYPGEYGPEALACMTEYDDSDNPDYLAEKKAEAIASGDFENVELIRISVDGKAIERILRPAIQAVPGTVVT